MRWPLSPRISAGCDVGNQCGGLPRFAVAIGFEAAGLDFFFMALDTLIYDG
jgi:hypothetical protein